MVHSLLSLDDGWASHHLGKGLSEAAMTNFDILGREQNAIMQGQSRDVVTFSEGEDGKGQDLAFGELEICPVQVPCG